MRVLFLPHVPPVAVLEQLLVRCDAVLLFSPKEFSVH